MIGSPEPVCVVYGGQRKADAERRQKAEVGALLEAALNRLRGNP